MRKIYFLIVLCWTTVFMGQDKWTLQQCVDYATKNNLQVINNQLNLQIQEKNLTIAKREYLPSVSGSLSNSSNFGESQDVFGSIRRNDNFNSNANIGANMMLYNGGRIKKNIKKNTFDLDASQLDKEATINDISLQIAQLYLQVLLNKEIFKISESAVANAKKVWERAKTTTQVGTTPLTIQYEAEAALAREKQRLQSSKIEVERALFQMSVLLQLDDYTSFDVADAPEYNHLLAPNIQAKEVLEIAFANQPQIKAAEKRLQSAQMQTELSKTQLKPSLTANAGFGSFYFNSLVFGTDKPYFEQMKNNFSQQLGVSLNVPIFNKGITKLQIEQAKINESVADNAIALQKQLVKQNVQKSYFDANASYENYRAALESEKSNQLALDYAEKSYAVGRTTIYDLSISRNNLVNAQGVVSQTKFNYVFSLKLLQFYAGIPLSL